MSKYSFYIDSKATVWTRSFRSIEAESEEEAKEIAKRIFTEEMTGWVSGEGEYESETLTDTYEPMSVEDNGGHSTEELIWPHAPNSPTGSIVIMDNIPVSIKREEKLKDILNEKQI